MSDEERRLLQREAEVDSAARLRWSVVRARLGDHPRYGIPVKLNENSSPFREGEECVLLDVLVNEGGFSIFGILLSLGSGVISTARVGSFSVPAWFLRE